MENLRTSSNRGKMKAMKLMSGTFVDGKVIVDGKPMPNGQKVAVIARDDDETFNATAEQEAELLEAITEIERGEGLDAREFLAQLRTDD